MLASCSFAFLLDIISNGVGRLEPLDALLVLAINQANIAPLTRDHEARARYGALATPAPDDLRRPLSINAAASSLGLPFETVRRRLRRLASDGVCRISAEGVIIPASYLASADYLSSATFDHERLRRFYAVLRIDGYAEGLPASIYPADPAAPVRAAMRLLADYVLRTAEGLMRETGNVISAVILVALLSAALLDDEAPAPATVKWLALQLGLPAETVRRHVADLEEDGLCARTSRGVAITEEILARPGLQLLLTDNAANVRRLLTGLAERGVTAAWEG
jgi:DNA-binding Lrp family transcriptional regulator